MQFEKSSAEFETKIPWLTYNFQPGNAAQCSSIQFNANDYNSIHLNTTQRILKSIEYAYALDSGQCGLYDESHKKSIQLNAAQCSSMKFNQAQCSSANVSIIEYAYALDSARSTMFALRGIFAARVLFTARVIMR